MVFLILLILIIFLIYFFNGRDCNLLGFSLILFTLLRIWSIYLFSELPIFILALNCCFLVSSDPFFFYRSIFLFAINYLVQLDWEWLHRGPLKGTKVQKLLALTWRCPYSLVPFCLHWHWCLLLISNFYFASNVDAVRQRSHLAFHKFWNFLWAGVNDSVKKQLLSAPHDVKAKGHSLAYIYMWRRNRFLPMKSSSSTLWLHFPSFHQWAEWQGLSCFLYQWTCEKEYHSIREKSSKSILQMLFIPTLTRRLVPKVHGQWGVWWML